MHHEFKRVAIVNRGEAAMRFIHAAREFNQEHNDQLRTIALYTDADRRSLFVREADEAFYLGPPQVLDSHTNQPKCAYVDYGLIESALLQARAEAVWVGWGFVAEHAQFADLCRKLGVVFIGPDGDVMRRMGDKISSKLLAEQAGIPIAPWSGGPVETVADAFRHADHLGFPLFIKATAGGGGHGIRRVNCEEELGKAYESARNEAFKAFGDPTVFMERLITGARHVEVQIIADQFGTTWAVGVRDCTIQRRQQKILEEAPSPALTPDLDSSIRSAALRLSKAAGYHNAGTVEFLFEPQLRRYLFMEMNTRLQVEHPVTECTTGIDLVKLQILVARGGKLSGERPRTVGHAIEVRLNAEDPDNGFAPSPGVIERFRLLPGPGVRVDTGVEQGDVVPAEFDSMIAKIIAHGRTRTEALSRLRRALRESVVVINGGTSNRAFLIELLGREEVRNSRVDVGWMDRLAATNEHLSREHVDIALIMAAIEAYKGELSVERTQFYASALRGRPEVHGDVGRTFELRYREHSYAMSVYRLGLRDYRVEVDGASIDAQVDTLGKFEYWLTAFGTRFHVVCVEQGLGYRIEVNGACHRIDRDDGGVVRSPSPAVVVSIAVKPGDVVSAGDRLAVLEAMKMEMQVVAPFGGKVRLVNAVPNVQVCTGAPLLQIEPTAEKNERETTPRLNFNDSPGEARATKSQWLSALRQLRQLVLGFDVKPGSTARLLLAGGSTDNSEAARHLEDEILTIFVDLCSLFRKNPKVNGRITAEVPSTEANLFAYLRMLDTQGEGLPQDFIASLKRALAHYGISSLTPSPDLEESLVWIYKAHQKLEHQVGPITQLLRSRLSDYDRRPLNVDERYRSLLDRLASITRGMFPVVSDLARELRYKYFDQPLFESLRQATYADAARHLDCIAASTAEDECRDNVRALIDCPQPLVTLVLKALASAGPTAQAILLEVILSRYYRVRTLTEFKNAGVESLVCMSARYEGDQGPVLLYGTYAPLDELDSIARRLSTWTQQAPTSSDVVIDFFTWAKQLPASVEAIGTQVKAAIDGAGFDHNVSRLSVCVCAPGENSIGPELHFTFERGESGYNEVELLRGVHPMMAERLHLWRLKNFKIERLPSVEDVYLLHATANDNPKDERVFAVAEIRDLTPVRDENGRLMQLPHLERMFGEATAAIRSFQSKRAPNARLHWNRILLYVWPTLDLTPDELNAIVRKLAPLTDGLGLEQVVVRGRIPNPRTGELRETILRISAPGDAGVLMTFRPAARLQPMKALTAYDQKVVKMRQRGMLYPYEIVKMLTRSEDETQAEYPPGTFVEYDLNAEGKLVPVDRPYGENKANVIVGVIRNFTDSYPEGMARVMMLGDPSKDLGAIAEAECRRILAALDLASELKVPLEWFPISAGAKISMDSGVENMDWIARVLRGLVEFTQSGGEINIVVNGINVGAQPYWNAESTMLMHTRGILIMTPKAAMVLTGKRALDYSGSVSAEDNQGIGGYDRIMGFNGQAQYFARDIDQACHILMRHYEHTYVIPGERFPRRAKTSDPIDRDVRSFPHAVEDCADFRLVGEIFSDETNPGRKKSFDIRRVMAAVSDQDHPQLERWAGMRSAETAVVWDAHLGGYPVCLIGIESKPVARFGFAPADGPDQWTAGTLFPLSSKKVARAINAASNNRPVVILANLSGFDGSPESMRRLQLEYGAEIGRSVVNFKGPIIFCVISRYHGGAYVVFSRTLNEQLEVVALEGTYASVIGGAPAAAVVFASEVDARARKDSRVVELGKALAAAEGEAKRKLQNDWDELFNLVHSEKLGEVASEFDRIHSVQRALEVGALTDILPPSNLRPYLIRAIERGIEKELQALTPKAVREEPLFEKHAASAA